MNQYITTITTTVPSGDDAERYRQSLRIAERDEDLRKLVASGYSLASTVTIPGQECVIIIDTLTRPADQ